MKKTWVTIIGTLLILGYFWLQFATYERPPGDDVSTFSDDGVGLSRLSTSLKKNNEQGVSVLGEPLLSLEQLENTSLLVMTSVIREVTEFEADLIKQYVEGGGGLLVSFHNAPTRMRLLRLSSALGLNYGTARSGTFKNKTIEAVSPSENGQFLRADERYALYSHLVWEDSDCAQDSTVKRHAGCYLREDQVGLGWVVTALGIPFFSNNLSGEEDNAKLAARIFSSQSRVTFDEFHHFFSNLTIGDLMTLPAFIGPLIGLVICVLMFFFLGPSHQIEPVRTGFEAPPRGFHDVNVGFLRSELKNATPESVTLQARYLERYFPSEAERVTELVEKARTAKADAREVFWRLGILHRNFLHERGRRQRQ